MNDLKPSPHAQALARQRAQLIMQVRSGVLRAQEAALQLGVSRKTYYKWERRALGGDGGGVGQSGTRIPESDE